MFKKSLILAFSLTSCLGIMSINSVQADLSRQAPKIIPKAQSMTQPKPPQCGPGFQVTNKQLKTSGGKSWYEYRCVQEQNIYRFCNPGQHVLMPKNTFSKLAGPPRQTNSVLRMTYSCGMLEG